MVQKKEGIEINTQDPRATIEVKSYSTKNSIP